MNFVKIGILVLGIAFALIAILLASKTISNFLSSVTENVNYVAGVFAALSVITFAGYWWKYKEEGLFSFEDEPLSGLSLEL
jgi:riboflavin transporter FmnP